MLDKIGNKFLWMILILIMNVNHLFGQNNQDSSTIHWLNAQEYHKNGDYLKAATHYTAIDQYNKRSEVLYNLGTTYLQMNKLGKAIWAFESANKINPKNEYNAALITANKLIENPYSDETFIIKKFLIQLPNIISWNTLAVIIMMLTLYNIYTIINLKRRRKLVNRILLIFNIMTIVLLSISLYTVNNTQYAIVSELQINTYLDESLTDKNDRTIPEGTKVEVESIDNNIAKILLPNGISVYIDNKYLLYI